MFISVPVIICQRPEWWIILYVVLIGWYYGLLIYLLKSLSLSFLWHWLQLQNEYCEPQSLASVASWFVFCCAFRRLSVYRPLRKSGTTTAHVRQRKNKTPCSPEVQPWWRTRDPTFPIFYWISSNCILNICKTNK